MVEQQKQVILDQVLLLLLRLAVVMVEAMLMGM
jgi:hypothetical protein